MNKINASKISRCSETGQIPNNASSRFFKRCYEDGLLAEDLEFTLPMETIMNNYKQMFRGLNLSLKRQGIEDPEQRQRIIAVLVNGLNAQDLQAVIDSRENTSVPQFGMGEKSIDIIGCLDQGRFDVRIALF